MKNLKKISKKKEEILSVSPLQALDIILNDEASISLIRSFSDEEFFLLMNEIGMEDFLPIVKNASNSQWQYILDATVWDKDRVNIKKLDNSFFYLFKSYQERFCNYLINDQLNLAELYIFKTINLRIREEDDDPSDFLRDGAITFDDTFYISTKEKDGKGVEILSFLAKYDYEKYQRLLLESASIIAPEIEEEDYRLRSIRLIEKGLMPFDEAISIFQIISYEELKKSKKYKQTYSESKKPFYKTDNNIILNVFDKVEDDNLRTEFAFLTNQLISVLGKKIKKRADIEKASKKVALTIKIGCEIIAEKEKSRLDENFILHLFKSYPLLYLFRFGNSKILKLRNRANKWLKESWFRKEKLKLYFWDENKMGFLGGILLNPPMFFTFKKKEMYRDFSSLEDIIEAGKELKEAIEIDTIFSILKPKIEEKVFLTYKTLILTLWAKRELGINSFFIPSFEFKKFFKELFTKNGKIKKEAKLSFFNFIESETSIKTDVFETLITKELEEEYKNVSKKDIDNRFVKYFLIKPT